MIGTIVLEVSQFYPDGLEVGLYNRSQFVEQRDAPIGVPITSSVVAEGKLSYGGLVENQSYRSAAIVNGRWQYINFIGPPAPDDDPQIEIAPIGTEGFGHAVMWRLENNLADVRILFLGDSTGAQIVYPDPYPRKLARELGQMFPTYKLVYHYWSEHDLEYQTLDEPAQDGTGDPVHGLHTLDVYNGCASGERVDYHLGHLNDQVSELQPHLTFMFHGHNHGAPYEQRLREDMVKGLAEFQRANPGGELVNGPQNPRFYNDPDVPEHPVNAPWEAQDQFGFALAELSREMGMGFVDVWQGFMDYTGGDLARIRGMLGTDNLHPREEGQQLWAQLIMDRLQIARHSQPKVTTPALLTIPQRNHAIDGLLGSWATVSTLTDLSGNGYHATVDGAPPFGGTFGGGRFRDLATTFATDDVVHVPTIVPPVGKDLLLVITIRPPDLTGGGIFGGTAADGPVLQHVGGATTVRFDPRRLGAASALNWTNVLTANVWHTLVLHYNDVTRTATLIHNGAVATGGSQVAAESLDTTPGTWDIGSFGNGTNFISADLQHAAIWHDWQGGLAAAQALAADLEAAADPLSLVGAEDVILPAAPTAYYAFNAGVPSGEIPVNLSLSNCSAAKDTVNWETKGYALKLDKLGAGASFAFKKLTEDKIRVLKGGHVTMVGRVRIELDEDNRGFAGRVGLNCDGTPPPDDHGDTIPPTQISNDVSTGKLVYKWNWVSRYLPADATFLTYFLYANRNSTGDAIVEFDRYGVFAGNMLRDPYA